MKIKLLVKYKGHKKGDIISVKKDIANTLIYKGIAKKVFKYSNTALASPKDKMMRSEKIN